MSCLNHSDLILEQKIIFERKEIQAPFGDFMPSSSSGAHLMKIKGRQDSKCFRGWGYVLSSVWISVDVMCFPSREICDLINIHSEETIYTRYV